MSHVIGALSRANDVRHEAPTKKTKHLSTQQKDLQILVTPGYDRMMANTLLDCCGVLASVQPEEDVNIGINESSTELAALAALRLHVFCDLLQARRF